MRIIIKSVITSFKWVPEDEISSNEGKSLLANNNT